MQIAEGATQAGSVLNTAITPQILKEGKEFLDIFSEEEARQLLPNKASNHAIELIGELLHRPLYNLLN